MARGSSKKKGARMQPEVVPQVRSSLEWLPRGWILQIKTQSSGEGVGRKYKCYFDPVSGSQFSSKAGVLRFVNSENFCTPTSREKRFFKASATDNVLAQIEYSPHGLPHGWIKELKFRKSKYEGIKADPYYTDPLNGYEFRSLKGAMHYVETGEICKHAFRPRKRSVHEMYSLEKESPQPIPVKKLKSLSSSTRRCLFTDGAPTSNGEVAIEIDASPDKLLLPPPDRASSEIPGFQITPLRRSSRRLAGLDPAPVTDLVIHQPSCHSMSNGRCNGIKEPVPSAEPERMDTKEKASLGEQMLFKGQTLGSSSPDPCIEFAIGKRESGSRAATDNSLDASSFQEQKAKRKSLPEKKFRSNVDPCVEFAIKNGNNRLRAATDNSLDTSSYRELKAMRGNLPKTRSRSEKEKKGLKALLEPPRMAVEKLSEPATKETTEKQQGAIKEKSVITLPTRSSKRLADLAVHCPSHQSPNSESSGIKKSVLLAGPGRKYGEEKSLGEQVLFKRRTSSEDLPSSPPHVSLPFCELWQDPCIEFAVKTLMGEIPVPDEGIAIEKYVQQRLGSSVEMEKLNPRASAIADTGRTRSIGSVELLPEKKHLRGPASDVGKACPSENGLASDANGVPKVMQKFKRMGL